MNRSTLLWIDAAINVGLGGLLIVFPAGVVKLLGIPVSLTGFYRSLLGAVLIGIGIALVAEARNRGDAARGLGLTGAVAINLCGGIMLGIWLVLGDLSIPPRGIAILWTLVVLLVGLSIAELLGGRGADRSRGESR